MKRLIKKGATDVTLDVWVPDSSSTTGAGLTGLVYNSAGLVCYYRRGATGSATALALATQTVGGAHSDGGFVEISLANMPGQYRLDLSDAIVASGVPYVTIMLQGATNMPAVLIELQLVDFDPEDAAGLGLSRLDVVVSSRASQASVDTIDDLLDTEIAAIISDLAMVLTRLSAARAANLDEITAARLAELDAANLPTDVAAAAIRAAIGLASANLDTQFDALPTADETRDAVFAKAFGADFGSKTFERMVELTVAMLLGRTAGAGTTSEQFKPPISGTALATVANDGADRTSVTLA